MHSSRMRTVRLLTVCRSIGACGGGGYLPRGVCTGGLPGGGDVCMAEGGGLLPHAPPL